MAFDFSNYAAILLDLDGTIYHADHALPGAVALLERLKREGRKYACLSNTTLSPQEVAQRLSGFGVTGLDADHIYTAAFAAITHILETFGPRPRVFNLATQGVHEMLDGKVHWVQGPGELCDVVMVGAPASQYASFDRQLMALQLLRDGAKLVGTSADRIYPTQTGVEFGSGALCAMLGYAANCTPYLSGKPQPVFFQNLCKKLGVEPSRCVLIGDNLETDIKGARQQGMMTILPLTGITNRKHLEALAPQDRPQLVIKDLTEL